MWSLRDIAARTVADSFNGPWWWEPMHWQRLHERGAPTETDAPRTHRNSLAFNLMVTVSLAVTGSPLGTGEAPLRGRGFSTGAYFPGNDGLIILVYSSGPIVRRVKCPKT